MSKTWPDRRRTAFVNALTEMDRYWGEVLEDEAFYDLNFSDLFTRMWLQRDHWFRKTDLHQLMPKVSHRTAVKYIQKAIDSGLLLEKQDPDDMRCKRIAMSDDLIQRIERFMDHALSTFEKGPFSNQKG